MCKMDQIPYRDINADLEAGDTVSVELGQVHTVSAVKLARLFFTMFCKVFDNVDRTIEVEVGFRLSDIDEASTNKVIAATEKKVEIVKAANIAGNQIDKEKRRASSAKKPPKPPRPPRGLSLDAADQKLIKEFAELAMLKRARTERLNALKKLKAAKAAAAAASSVSSSSGSVFSMLFTIIFCLVILFQGVSSKSLTVSCQGPLEVDSATQDSSVLNDNCSNPSARDISTRSEAPRLSSVVTTGVLEITIVEQRHNMVPKVQP